MKPARHSVATIESLIHSLIRTIDLSRESATHLRETDDFLVAIREHLGWYDKIVHSIQQDATFPNSEVADLVRVIGNVVFQLIESVKGLSEGTTDRIPFALATLLNREIHECLPSPPYDRKSIALFPVTEINYFYQDVSSYLGKDLETLDKWIVQNFVLRSYSSLPNAPTFPTSLVAIGFQYAMVDDVLYNSILFHELGHHVFKSRDFASAWRTEITKNLNRVFGQRLPEFKRYLSRQIISDPAKFLESQVDIIMSWIEELFCDAFGAAVAGPQYSFAFQSLAGPRSRSLAFYPSHPADDLRRYVQHLVLDRLEWLSERTRIARNSTFTRDAKSVIRQIGLRTLPAEKNWQADALVHETSHETVARMLIHEIVKHPLRVAKQAIQSVPNAKSRAVEFWRYGTQVADSFEAAVVPSTIVVRASKRRASPRHLHPLPSTVMNVARILFERDIPRLKQRWAPGAMNDHDRSVQIHRRLSEWTQKAVSDWLLITGASNATQP